MKKGLGLAFLVLTLIHCGASASRQTNAGASEENPKKSGSNAATVSSPQGFAADQLLKFFGRKTGKDLMAGKKGGKQGDGSEFSKGGERVSGVSESSSNPVPLGASNFTKSPALAVPRAFQLPPVARAVNNPAVLKVHKLAVPPPPVSRVAVPQIRQEIQRILELNKQIKTIQGGRAGQFQRVQEQAQLHQKILNDLESAQQEDKDRKTPQREDLLAQEKLRIIHEETQRNAALLEAAEDEDAASSGPSSSSSGRVLQFKRPEVTEDPVPESELEPRNS